MVQADTEAQVATAVAVTTIAASTAEATARALAPHTAAVEPTVLVLAMLKTGVARLAVPE